MKELTFKRLLSLVNSALWDKEIDESLFAQMNEQAWNDLYLFSIRHGVMAITFDGISCLSSLLHPPLRSRMQWALSVENIEKKYLHIDNIVHELTSMYSTENIDMLVFKGLYLSNYYPIPFHREFGDIDIYLFGQFEKGDQLLAKAGAIEIKTPSYKHSNYYYKNILIENHAFFLNVHDSSETRRLNEVLIEILVKEKTKQNTSRDTILFPPVNFNALHFMVHALRHFSVGSLPLRTYCDWALFLEAHGHEIDIYKWKKELQSAQLLDLAETITSVTSQWLEAKIPSSLLSLKDDRKRENRITEEMWQPVYPSCKSSNKFAILSYNVRKFHDRNKRLVFFQKKNFYLNYPKSFLRIFLKHIKSPKSFFRAS